MSHIGYCNEDLSRVLKLAFIFSKKEGIKEGKRESKGNGEGGIEGKIGGGGMRRKENLNLGIRTYIIFFLKNVN